MSSAGVVGRALVFIGNRGGGGGGGGGVGGEREFW